MLKERLAQKIGNGQGARVTIYSRMTVITRITTITVFGLISYDVTHEVQKPSNFKHEVKFE